MATTCRGPPDGWFKKACTLTRDRQNGPIFLLIHLRFKRQKPGEVAHLPGAGVASGHLRLSGSNYDWGQGLPDLGKWQQEHGVEEVNVWYFGTDPSVHMAPLRQLPLDQSGNQRAAEAVQR